MQVVTAPSAEDVPQRAAAAGRPADAVIELDGVSKRFGNVVAIEHLDLRILRGEFFSLLGPSGCGKTTTLRIVGGFELPTQGLVRLDGRDVTDLPPHRRDVNTVFQSYGLFPHLNVFDNVAFGLRRRKVGGRDVERRVGEMLELVGLPTFGKRRPAQLSGGQQQRVALARALVNRPQVLLLDEPLGALDLKLRKQMQLELKRIQREVGITFIFVTHDQEEAMTISDRIAVMNDGLVEQLGRPEEVYERPASVFVAEFLGASNLLDGVALGVQGGWAAVRLDSGHEIRAPSAAAPLAGTRVRAGVRPEKVQVLAETPDLRGTWNTVKGRLTSAVFVGVSYQYFFETEDGRTLTVFASNSGAGPVVQPGDQACLAWPPEHTFVLSADAAQDDTAEVTHG